jgi:hypothetical protein
MYFFFGGGGGWGRLFLAFFFFGGAAHEIFFFEGGRGGGLRHWPHRATHVGVRVGYALQNYRHKRCNSTENIVSLTTNLYVTMVVLNQVHNV